MTKWDYAIILTVDPSGNVTGGMHGVPKPLYHALNESGESGWELSPPVPVQGCATAIYVEATRSKIARSKADEGGRALKLPVAPRRVARREASR
jgi:hypothetical protein